jgi:FMN phosphatase YigB (HAD superfamily)
MSQELMPSTGEANADIGGGPVEAVVFDLFDTLVDLYTEKLPRIEYRGLMIPASARALHASLPHRNGIEFDEFARSLAGVDGEFKISHYDKGVEVPSEVRFAALCERLGMMDPRLPTIMAHVHMGLLREQVAMPLNHLGILCSLAENYKVGLCSNFSHSVTAQAVLEDYGLLPQLHAIVISDDVGIRKPRIEIFRAVLDDLAVDASEALFVGNSLQDDIAGADRAGMRSVWIRRRIKDPEALLENYAGPRPTYQIDDLDELEGILGALEQS